MTYSGDTAADSNPRIGPKATAENGGRSVRIQLKLENQRPSISVPARSFTVIGQSGGQESDDVASNSTRPPPFKCSATSSLYWSEIRTKSLAAVSRIS